MNESARIDPNEVPVCVMTRLRLRGPWALVRFAWHYRRVRKTVHRAPGLMHASLLAEGPLTWCMLSVWRTEEQMEQWSGTPEHVTAVRLTYRDLARESWSGRWRLDAVSPTARQWAASPAMAHADELACVAVGHRSASVTGLAGEGQEA